MSHRIINNEFLNQQVFRLTVEAADIAAKIKPGQFIILRLDEKAERIPLTVSQANPQQGYIQLIIQKIGTSTIRLSELKPGDIIQDMIGPLGQPTEIKNYGKVICIAGGVGIAEIYPLAAALKNAGNTLSSIIGARNKDLLMLEQEIKQLSSCFYSVTDDGSAGAKGNVGDILKKLLTEQSYDIVFAVGPVAMMKAIAELTKKYKLKTIVSLNSIMVDGTGMCGSCRVSIAGKTKFVCVDGPDFDAHLVDFAELAMRQKRFTKQEKHCLPENKEHKACH
ncbi:MAG: sulfide/dihydroorotate dehydrogenase-like FAD/NAD-binding protein [Candidatus Omnitrophica bacterium]|nr:sulfide/dihydroorotate dehydrogenase-like FAD/NAD-binding protein [Candidatus Omnitrophota bacterium]